MVCSYQVVNYTLVITDKQGAFAITDGPIAHRGTEEIEREITSHHLKIRREYRMAVNVHTSFESSNKSYTFSKFVRQDG